MKNSHLGESRIVWHDSILGEGFSLEKKVMLLIYWTRRIHNDLSTIRTEFLFFLWRPNIEFLEGISKGLR